MLLHVVKDEFNIPWTLEVSSIVSFDTFHHILEDYSAAVGNLETILELKFDFLLKACHGVCEVWQRQTKTLHEALANS